jgi:regulatory protein
LRVTLEGNVTADVDAEVAGLYGVMDGREYTAGEWQRILELSARKRAKDLALAALSRHELSETQLRRKLRGRRIPGPLVDEVLADLRRTGLLNDEAFARRLGEDLVQRRMVGPRRLRQELTARGIAPEIAEVVVGESYAGEAPVALARALLARKRFGPDVCDNPDRRKKAISMLLQRGFTWDTINDVLGGLTEGG